jgi:cellulose synthase/poly-beta-1,6-N-acetylglucosamine synthase-like glycosyltransferase
VHKMKAFTLVSTVFNEMSRLAATISDIEGQSLKPDEIVITDAGSTDGTFDELKKWSASSSIKIVVLQKQGCNVAQGRNIAIGQATHDLIVSTDFGCRFHKDWLKSLVTSFDTDVKVVGGNFSVLEQELTSLPERAAYICANGYQNKMDDTFLPSSRSIAYYRQVWEEIGGYPESLTLAGDDTTFALKLKERGIKIHLVKEPFVYWLRPKKMKGYLNEAKRYAIGDAESRDKQNLRNVFVNTTELILRLLFIVMVIAVAFDLLSLTIPVWVLLTVSTLGFRSMIRITRRWWRLRSPKYDLNALMFAYVFFDLSRLNYLYWYAKVLVREPRGRIS